MNYRVKVKSLSSYKNGKGNFNSGIKTNKFPYQQQKSLPKSIDRSTNYRTLILT